MLNRLPGPSRGGFFLPEGKYHEVLKRRSFCLGLLALPVAGLVFSAVEAATPFGLRRVSGVQKFWTAGKLGRWHRVKIPAHL